MFFRIDRSRWKLKLYSFIVTAATTFALVATTTESMPALIFPSRTKCWRADPNPNLEMLTFLRGGIDRDPENKAHRLSFPDSSNIALLPMRMSAQKSVGLSRGKRALPIVSATHAL